MSSNLKTFREYLSRLPVPDYLLSIVFSFTKNKHAILTSLKIGLVTLCFNVISLNLIDIFKINYHIPCCCHLIKTTDVFLITAKEANNIFIIHIHIDLLVVDNHILIFTRKSIKLKNSKQW